MASCVGQWPAKHKKQMGTVVMSSTNLVHQASDTQIELALVDKWILAREGPPPRIPLVQLMLRNGKKKTFELTTWEHQREFSAALQALRTALEEARKTSGAAPSSDSSHTAAAAPGALVGGTGSVGSPGAGGAEAHSLRVRTPSPHGGIASAAGHSGVTQGTAPAAASSSAGVLGARRTPSHTQFNVPGFKSATASSSSSAAAPSKVPQTKQAGPQTKEEKLAQLKPLARLIVERPKIRQLYTALVPETLNHDQFFGAFQGQVALARNQEEPPLVRHARATPIKIQNDERGEALNLTKDDIEALFLEHPHVKKVYDDVVVEARTNTPAQFFGRFFRSNYYLKCEGKPLKSKQDLLFDSIPPPTRSIPSAVQVELPRAFTQWNITPKTEKFEKDPLLAKLNRLSAEPLQKIPRWIPDEAPEPKKPRVEKLHLHPERVFYHKSTGQQPVERNLKFVELSSRRTSGNPETPEFKRSMRHFLRDETKAMRNEPMESPVLSTEFDTIEGILAHYYVVVQSSNDAVVKAKLKKRLEGIVPPPSLLRAVRKIINS